LLPTEDGSGAAGERARSFSAPVLLFLISNKDGGITFLIRNIQTNKMHNIVSYLYYNITQNIT
jgi:hypothetical protein